MDRSVTALSTAVVEYFVGCWNHGLTVRREVDNRRRKFRNEIRWVSLRFEKLQWSHFTKTYQQSVADVSAACVKIPEAIKCFSQFSFAK